MGRSLESPWEVRWVVGGGFRHVSLFHDGRRVLQGLSPHNMLPVAEAAGIATSDLRHLLVWAAWVVTVFYVGLREGDDDMERYKARRCKARSILVSPPGTSFDFDRFWSGWPVSDGAPVLTYASVADLPPPPPEEVVYDGISGPPPECVDDLLAFITSRGATRSGGV